MRNLIIVRHAKSLHDEYVNLDIERHLAPRGYKDAGISASWCAEKEIKPDLMVSSPAIRAFSTALIFADHLSYPTDKIRLNTTIYEASVHSLLDMINTFKDEYKSIMLFGHNPGFSDLINTLCGPVIIDLPTAAVAILRFKDLPWKQIKPESGKLIEIYSRR